MNKQRNRYALFSILLALVALLAATVSNAQEDASESPAATQNYLYIQEFEIAAGESINGSIAEAQGWVKAFRATGEYKSVRLFMHNIGSRLALYILAEPKSWQAIEDGDSKFFAANPEILEQPITWATHSDNLLTEIAVE